MEQETMRIRASDVFEVATYVSIVFIFVALLASMFGCRTREVEKVVLLNDHVLIVEPGSTVPPLPEGETRWWLMTGRGMKMMVPGD